MASNEDWPHVGDRHPTYLSITPKQLASARRNGYITRGADGIERIITNMDGATVLTEFRVDRS